MDEKKVNEEKKKETLQSEVSSQQEEVQGKVDYLRQAKDGQVDILVKALEDAAKDKDGMFVNQLGKSAPHIYGEEQKYGIPAFNKLILSLHSDQSGYKTNGYTSFVAATQRNESIRKNQTGVPYIWQMVKGYESKDNPSQQLSRKEYNDLDASDKTKYRPVIEERFMKLFNIEQTIMPNKEKEKFQEEVGQKGSYGERITSSLSDVPQDKVDWHLQRENVNLRHDVNQFLDHVNENLVHINRSGMGLSAYDEKKDVVNLPLQKVFSSYEDYVQEATRQIAVATGHSQRLNRVSSTEDSQVRNQLVYELASASKMLDFGLSAKLSPESQKLVPVWVQQLKERPEMLDDVMRDVNRTMSMIDKAANGYKIERAARQQPVDLAPVQDKTRSYSLVTMLKDDEGKWTLFARPENEKGFAIHPFKEDVSKYFDALKNSEDSSKLDAVRNALAQKYENLLKKSPNSEVHLFKSKATQEELDMVTSVNVFRGQGKEGKVPLVVAQLGNDQEKQKAKLVPKDMYQRLFLADDMKDYKKHIAAMLYADEIAEKLKEVKLNGGEKEGVDSTVKNSRPLYDMMESKEKAQREAQQQQQEEEKRRNSPEQKEKERQEEKVKEETTRAETKAVAAVALSPMMKQFLDLKHKHPDALLLFRTGDFYETYKQDAEKASRILGITLTKSTKQKDEEGKPLTMAGFPYHALDTYLPKLIRAGERVAICDQLEAPKQTASRSISEMVSPGVAETNEMKEEQAQQQEQKQKVEEEHHRGGFHL